MINHQDNFGTNLTSGTSASDTTSPLNSIPSIAAPFYIAFDATNINNHYETKLITSKTATNVLHSALSYDHTTAEEVRMVVPAEELNSWDTVMASGWNAYSAVTPTRASADDPTYVLTFAGVDLTSTISVGMRLKWTQNSTVRYGIVTAISFSTNTTLTLYGGTDYDVDDTATHAISAFNYSTQKAPLGFPLSPTKWTVTTTSTSDVEQATPTATTWYNLGTTTIVLPIGVWDVKWGAQICQLAATAIAASVYGTLSTANNSESNSAFTAGIVYTASSNGQIAVMRNSVLEITSKTTYYLNAKTGNASMTKIMFIGTASPTIIRAVCAYL